MDSSTENHASINPNDLSFTQLDIKSTFSDPTCSNPTETASLIQQGQVGFADFGELTETKNYCCPSSITDKSMDDSSEKHESMNPKDLRFTQPDIKSTAHSYVCHQLCLPRITKVPSISVVFVSNTCKTADVTFFRPKSRDDTSGNLTPLPTISWQKETSLLRVLGSVCAAIVAACWGWKLFNAPVNNDDN